MDNDLSFQTNDYNPTEISELDLLVGAQIVNIGFLPSEKEGGLTIDYKHEDGVVKRIVLGYTELGTWVQWHGVKTNGQNN